MEWAVEHYYFYTHINGAPRKSQPPDPAEGVMVSYCLPMQNLDEYILHSSSRMCFIFVYSGRPSS